MSSTFFKIFFPPKNASLSLRFFSPPSRSIHPRIPASKTGFSTCATDCAIHETNSLLKSSNLISTSRRDFVASPENPAPPLTTKNCEDMIFPDANRCGGSRPGKLSPHSCACLCSAWPPGCSPAAGHAVPHRPQSAAPLFGKAWATLAAHCALRRTAPKASSAIEGRRSFLVFTARRPLSVPSCGTRNFRRVRLLETIEPRRSLVLHSTLPRAE